MTSALRYGMMCLSRSSSSHQNKHYSNSSGIGLIRFHLSQDETFSVKICVERIGAEGV